MADAPVYLHVIRKPATAAAADDDDDAPISTAPSLSSLSFR